MKIEVVTTFNQEGYEQYGKTFINTFEQYWAPEIELHVYNEGGKGGVKVGERVFIHSYEEECPLGVEFKKQPKPHIPADVPNPYRFRVDKFSHKIFSLAAHMRKTKADYVVLIDADVETFDTVTPEWVEDLAVMRAKTRNNPPRVESHVACLLRPWFHHTECGFVLYKVCGKTKDMVQTMEDVYTSGHIYTQDGWCDSSCFDYVRKRFEEERGLIVRNLTNPCETELLDVWPTSPLGEKMVHKKGALKYGPLKSDSNERACPG